MIFLSLALPGDTATKMKALFNELFTLVDPRSHAVRGNEMNRTPSAALIHSGWRRSGRIPFFSIFLRTFSIRFGSSESASI